MATGASWFLSTLAGAPRREPGHRRLRHRRVALLLPGLAAARVPHRSGRHPPWQSAAGCVGRGAVGADRGAPVPVRASRRHGLRLRPQQVHRRSATHGGSTPRRTPSRGWRPSSWGSSSPRPCSDGDAAAAPAAGCSRPCWRWAIAVAVQIGYAQVLRQELSWAVLRAEQLFVVVVVVRSVAAASFAVGHPAHGLDAERRGGRDGRPRRRAPTLTASRRRCDSALEDPSLVLLPWSGAPAGTSTRRVGASSPRPGAGRAVTLIDGDGDPAGRAGPRRGAARGPRTGQCHRGDGAAHRRQRAAAARARGPARRPGCVPGPDHRRRRRGATTHRARPARRHPAAAGDHRAAPAAWRSRGCPTAAPPSARC